MPSGQQKSFAVARPSRASRRLGYPLVSLVSLAGTGILGLVLYAAGSIFYLSHFPGDSLFAEQSECLTRALAESRFGFAVSPDGSLVAGYGDTRVAVCSRGLSTAKRVMSWPGISAAAFDLDNRLWLSQRQGTALTVSRMDIETSERDGTARFAGPWDSIIALTGHRQGVAALDSQGRLVSISPSGAVLGQVDLPRPLGPTQMAANSDGSLIAIVSNGVLFVHRAADASLVQRQAPCEVCFAWWANRPREAIVDCCSDAGVALRFDAVTGSLDLLPRQPRIHSRYIPGLSTYVQTCENLPCRAPSP